jgi:hypothetical protein
MPAADNVMTTAGCSGPHRHLFRKARRVDRSTMPTQYTNPVPVLRGRPFEGITHAVVLCAERNESACAQCCIALHRCPGRKWRADLPLWVFYRLRTSRVRSKRQRVARCAGPCALVTERRLNHPALHPQPVTRCRSAPASSGAARARSGSHPYSDEAVTLQRQYGPSRCRSIHDQLRKSGASSAVPSASTSRDQSWVVRNWRAPGTGRRTG